MNILKTILNKKNLYQNKNPTKNCGMEKTMLYKFNKNPHERKSRLFH